MKKVLQVNNTMNIGGIETFLKNVFEKIDKDNYSFDFLCYQKTKFDYEKEIQKLGGKFIKIDNPKKVGILKHYIQLNNILKNNKYDAIHCHTYFDSALVLLCAKKNGIKLRICHSHTTEGNNNVSLKRKIKWKICTMLINYFSNYRIACSDEAGKALYGKKDFVVLSNGIDVEKFKYNENFRNEIRKKYDIKDNEFLIGHVGRLSKEKNHKFLIELLYNLKQKNKNKYKYKMIFVGAGKELSNIQNDIEKFGLTDDIILVGNALDAYKYYNAFDLFAFPSIYEGLGISLIEAQTNGLVCLASSTVPKESKITDDVYFLNTNNKNQFEEYIYNCNKKRIKKNYEMVLKSDFSILTTVKKIEEIYNSK